MAWSLHPGTLVETLGKGLDWFTGGKVFLGYTRSLYGLYKVMGFRVPSGVPPVDEINPASPDILYDHSSQCFGV